MRSLYLILIAAIPYSVCAQSDDCSTAVEIIPNLTSCSSQAGSSANATQSVVSCSGGGNADDDVWYYFTANSTTMTIEVDPTVGYDAVIQLLNGNCLAGQISCSDINGLNGDESITATGLSIGQDYYFRVYHYGVGSGSSTFNVCVYGLAPPTNNTPCNAFALPAVEPSCNFESYTNLGSAGSTVPTPTGCGGSTGTGNYLGGDVWFSVVVPPSGILDIHTQIIDFNDGAMALYSGTCSSPVLVACDDDSGPSFMPYIYASGLTPGATMFIRIWEFGNNNNGTFGLCVSSPDNDDCANAQQICDLNGYGGITSSAYTIDQPSNMCGIGNPLSPNPGCVFGTGYTGVSPVQIDNNSWLQFTASATTAELFVEISSCANGNGMQMQIFEGTNCTNFIPVSNFLETTTSQTVLATGLTPGNTYYIVVDGFAGDICSYTISATSGVQVVEAIAADDQLCLGEGTSITAQVTGTGSYTYTWSSDPFGTYPSTPTISVNPTVTTEYTVDITGLCGTTTSASVLVTVNPNPTANAGVDQTICDGVTTNISATGGSSYNWDNGLGSGSSHSISPSTSSTYEVTVTDATGCTDVDQVLINVNPTPVANAGNDDEVCDGSPITLTASGGGDYDWGSGYSSNPSYTFTPSSSGNVTVTVQNGFGCTDTDVVMVTVNPLPNAFAGNDITVCNGGSTTLNASGGVSYDWDDPSLADVSSQTIGPLTSNVTYVVTVTDAKNCVATDDINITVGSALIPDAGPDSSVCLNTPLNYSATGGVNYTWTNSGGSTVSTTENFSPSTSNPGTFWYYVEVTDGGSCSGNDSIEVIVNPLPIANAGSDIVICEGDSAILSGSGGATYTWNQGLGAGQTHTVIPTTTTTYQLSVTDLNGCDDTDDISVIVNALPTILASSDQTICFGEIAAISANGGTSYTWNQGLGSGQNQSVSPSSTTTYIVTGTNANNCSNIDSVEITVNDLPLIDTSSIQIEDADCVNGGGTISGIAVIGNPAFSYVWSDGVNNIDTLLSLGSLTPGTYVLTVTDANNCVNQIQVEVDFINLATLLAQNDTAQTNPAVQVNVAAYNNDIGDSTTITIITNPINGTATSNGDGSVSYTPNANFTGIDSLEYEICDVICTAACERAWIIYIVNDKLPVDVPNGFSPNTDGYNDFFVIDNLEQYPDNSITIFSRWGDLVYSAEPYLNDWDGTPTNTSLQLRGDKVVDGTYYFILKLEDGIEPINGFVELRTK